MAAVEFVDQYWPKIAVALLLTFASGVVDITGYLGAFHLFTAHLTGTTVQLGHSLVAGRPIEVASAVTIVAAFVAGSLIGRLLIEIAARAHVRRIASVTFVMESIILLAVVRYPLVGKAPYGTIALLAAAMGLQTATLTGIGPLTVHTTFVTGMINKIAQLLCHMAFRGYDLHRGKARDQNAWRDQRRDIEMSLFLLSIWLFYVAGAAIGSWAFGILGISTLNIAVALLGIGLITDQMSPLSIHEEREQLER